jgi:serine/threonine protein kinase
VQVALKVMLPRVAADKRARDLFLRETEVTKAMKHPKIVELKDHGCSDATFFFTLEFCDGGSVDKLMAKRRGRLSIEEAGRILWDVLDGLEYAHNAEVSVKLKDGSTITAHGVVHRDLSPHNIFLCGSGSGRVAKVADFGLAKNFELAGLSGDTRTGTAAGKQLFMPRQQVINFKYAKPEVDVWAAAASLYNMLTGQYPRDFPRGEDPWRIPLDQPTVPIRKRDPSIPIPLAAVIDHALIDKPEIPFKTAAEFRRALEGAL